MLEIAEDFDFEDEMTEYDNRVDSVDTVGVYLKQIGKVALLSAVQEVEIAKRIEAGLYAKQYLARVAGEEVSHLEDIDPEAVKLTTACRRDLQYIARDGEAARNHMIEANLRLVVSIAKRYQGKGLDFLDLIEEGNLGLIRAIEKFDYTKGFKFSTYATWWVRQGIARALADQSRMIRLPVHKVEVVNKVNNIKRDLSESLGREPLFEEIAEEAEIDTEKVIEVLGYKDPMSLNMLIGDNDDVFFSDFIEDADMMPVEDQVIESTMQESLHKTLRSILTPKEYQVIVLRAGMNGHDKENLEEIGAHYQVSRERIRQIEVKAKKKILEHNNGSLRALLVD